MAAERFAKVVAKVLVFGLLASAGLSSCTPARQLPEEPRDALMTYWKSLPSYPDVEHRVIRAWPGRTDGDADAPSGEVWCVEAAIDAPQDPSVDGERLVWIVTRENREARWTAALLASLSSLWPYEACAGGPA